MEVVKGAEEESPPLTDQAKLLLLASLLAKDDLIGRNGKAFLKEAILRRDPAVSGLVVSFDKSRTAPDGASDFLTKVNEVIDNESLREFERLFLECPLEVGKDISKSERVAKDLTGKKSLIYGEVDYLSFVRILRRVAAPAGSVFYDLGSGSGKAVFAARFSQDYGRCVGIEILDGLHEAAVRVVDRYNKKFRHLLDTSLSQHASVYHGSLEDFDWSDGDVVFANSTCFDDSLMKSIGRLAEKLRPGAVLITFTKGIESDKFELMDRKRYRMSWGPATVFVHRRLDYDGSAVDDKVICLDPEEDGLDDDEADSVSDSDDIEVEDDGDSDNNVVLGDVEDDVGGEDYGKRHNKEGQVQRQNGQGGPSVSVSTRLQLEDKTPESPIGARMFVQDPEVLDSPQGAALLRRKASRNRSKGKTVRRRVIEEEPL